MPLDLSLKRLQFANAMIRKKATGNLGTFAKKMNLSKSGLKKLLSEMRELGAPIQYDRLRETYYFTEDGEVCISKFMKYGEVVTREELVKIGKPEDLCFSEKAIFVPCKDI
jgi:predicted transcriptional regulator